MSNKSRIVVIKDLTLVYGNNVIYQDFSYTFSNDKVHVILGKSGCGKTSLLNAIANLVQYQGEIDVGKISYVFQQPRLAKTTVFNNVEMVLTRDYPQKEERFKVVKGYLELAEIADKTNVNVNNLSGGEQQRVSLARAFAYPSNLLLMDEPFKSLDLGIRKTLYKTLDNMLRQNARTTLLVTHDVDEALALADKIYLLHDSPCVLQEFATLSLPRNQRDLYREDMLTLRKKLEEML